MKNNERKSICFMMPGIGNKPVGGYKVAFEYANLFSKKGYKVAIYYGYKIYKNFSLISLVKNFYHIIMHYIFKKYTCRKWFSLNPEIKEYVTSLSYRKIKMFDAACATAVNTAYTIAGLNYNIKKLYLIQDFEKWNGMTDEYVMNSYRLPLNKIVISPWLMEKVNEAGSSATLIYNGFDFDYFKLTTPIQERNPYHICMLNHLDDRKRCEDSFAALNIVHNRYPKLIVNIFGVPERPENLPDWYHYIQKPSKEKHNFLYNDSSIFVAASKAEGMALPPAEAMICGCALVCTDIPGFAMYAINNETALTSPVFDYKTLANNIIKLIEDNSLRENIAVAGNRFIQKYTWDNAFEKFEKLVIND